MWARGFLYEIAERAIKTFCQALAALLLAGGGGIGILDAPWGDVLSVAAMAAIGSVLTTIGSASATGGNASLTPAETTRSKPAVEVRLMQPSPDQLAEAILAKRALPLPQIDPDLASSEPDPELCRAQSGLR